MTFQTVMVLSGPLRKPRQMLGDQAYDGHVSIHDDNMAQKLGLRAGPIEGPTHFSQFVPLLENIFGQAWFERGCFSAHFQNMVVEGEEVQAFVELPPPGFTRTKCWAKKADGTPVLEASASIGPHHGQTLLESRMSKLAPPGPLVILSDLRVGMKSSEDVRVVMGADQHMGDLYPFTLNQKLEVITEYSHWHACPATPWGRATIPLEMVSVLVNSHKGQTSFPVKGPSVGLFADLEIRMMDGPLFVGEEYVVRREIVALSQSKRTESYWVRSTVYDSTGSKPVAQMLLNSAVLKASYAKYDEELAALPKG